MNIVVCSNCGMKVVAMLEGKCPSCGQALDVANTSSQEVINPVSTSAPASSENRQSIPTHFDLLWILFSLKGRLSLGMMWISTPISIIISLGPSYLASAFSFDLSIQIVLYLLGLVLMGWSTIAISAKRFHDVGWPGWLVLLGLFPMFGPTFIFCSIGCLKGNRGTNRYGIDPRRIWSAGMIDEIL